MSVSTDTFSEKLFLILFAAFFTSRLNALYQIGLSFGNNTSTFIVFLIYSLVFLGLFYQVRKLFLNEERTRLKTIYLLLAFAHSLAPYGAFQVSWWFEYVCNQTKYLPNKPESWALIWTFVPTVILFVVDVLLMRKTFQKIYKALAKRWWIEKHSISIFLCLILIISFLLIHFWLVPCGLLSIDLGLNLMSEVFGILLTVFFITKILNWNEERLWKKVKIHVFDRLGEELHYIIIDLIYYLDLPNNLKVFGIGPKITEDLKRNFFERLKYVCMESAVSLNKAFKEMVQAGGYKDLYARREKYLNNIETKYFRFLSPHILVPIMNIQKGLHSIDLRIRINQNRIQKRLSPIPSEEEFYENISKLIHLICNEICRLREAGIKIYFE